MRFASFLSGGISHYGSNKSIGRETGKMNLCAMCFIDRYFPQFFFQFEQLKKKKNMFDLFVTSKNESSNFPIHEFKLLQNVFKIKEQDLECFLD